LSNLKIVFLSESGDFERKGFDFKVGDAETEVEVEGISSKLLALSRGLFGFGELIGVVSELFSEPFLCILCVLGCVVSDNEILGTSWVTFA